MLLWCSGNRRQGLTFASPLSQPFSIVFVLGKVSLEAQAGLRLEILPPQPPQYWDCKMHTTKPAPCRIYLLTVCVSIGGRAEGSLPVNPLPPPCGSWAWTRAMRLDGQHFHPQSHLARLPFPLLKAFLFRFKFLFYVYVLPACTYETPHLRLVPEEARRGIGFPETGVTEVTSHSVGPGN